jgi:hypothetical protein
MRAITAVTALLTKIFPGLLGYQLVYLAKLRG